MGTLISQLRSEGILPNRQFGKPNSEVQAKIAMAQNAGFKGINTNEDEMVQIIGDDSAVAVLDSEKPERFVSIFNGTYTITSPTGEHRTFMIRTQPKDSGFHPGKRIISLFTGTDNTNNMHYTGFGWVDDRGVSVWNSKMGKPGAKSIWEKYADLVWSMGTEGEASKFHAKGARMMMEGRCCRCNRKLTNPESIATGIGPECASRG